MWHAIFTGILIANEEIQEWTNCDYYQFINNFLINTRSIYQFHSDIQVTFFRKM